MTSPLLTIFFVGPIMWFTTQLMTLVLFRQNIKNNIANMIYTSFITHVFSLTLHYMQLALLTALVQPFILILCYCLFYRYKWKHSVIMIAVTYPISGVIEILVHYLSSIINRTHIMDTLVLNDDFSLLIYCELIYLLIILVLQKFRLGFTFIQQSKLVIKNDPYLNILLLLSLACLCMLAVSGFSMHIHIDSRILFFTTTPIIILSIVLFEQHYKKDIQYE